MSRFLTLCALIAAMFLVGCQRPRPDFMTRVRQDCLAGQAWACELIDALNKPPPEESAR